MYFTRMSDCDVKRGHFDVLLFVIVSFEVMNEDDNGEEVILTSL